MLQFWHGFDVVLFVSIRVNRENLLLILDPMRTSFRFSRTLRFIHQKAVLRIQLIILFLHLFDRRLPLFSQSRVFLFEKRVLLIHSHISFPDVLKNFALALGIVQSGYCEVPLCCCVEIDLDWQQTALFDQFLFLFVHRLGFDHRNSPDHLFAFVNYLRFAVNLAN